MRFTRRGFLAASAAVAAVPFVRSRAAGESSDKVRLAVIGVADRGSANLAGVAGEEIVALCEVDEPRADKARKQYPDAKFFTDYRKMFDAVAGKVDAVVVSTPDHSHAYAALLALKSGKHVYCEKPLAHSIEEIRRMKRAVHQKTGLVTQMGTQIHAENNYRRVVEIVQAGKLGAVNRVHVWCSRKPDPMKKIKPTSPVKFDTDLWLGPVPEEFLYAEGPSKHSWPHFDWRWWWPFGGGVLADMGCHFMDLPFWALKLTAPKTVTATGTKLANCDNTVPETLQVDYQFPAIGKNPAVHLTWYHGVPGPDLAGKVTYPGYSDGVLFEGEGGKKLVANYSKYQLFPDEFAKDFKAPDPTIPKSLGHHKEWLEAIRGKGQALCRFDYAAPLAEAVLLGNVAYRVGKEIAWDAANWTVTNAPEADQFVRCPVRKGWEFSV